MKPINPNRDTRLRSPRHMTLMPKKRPGRDPKRSPSGGLGYSQPSPSPTNLVFWYHRYEASPTFTVERIARVKGMIPIFSISNSTYSWGTTYENLALQFQEDNNNCTIAMAQSFWSRTATITSAWPVGATWANTYPTRRLADSDNVIVMIDVEPPDVLPDEDSIIDQFLNKKPTGETTLGIAGTPTQVADAISFVSARAGSYAIALPDLRDENSIN